MTDELLVTDSSINTSISNIGFNNNQKEIDISTSNISTYTKQILNSQYSTDKDKYEPEFQVSLSANSNLRTRNVVHQTKKESRSQTISKETKSSCGTEKKRMATKSNDLECLVFSDGDNYSGTTEIIKVPPICDICNKWFSKKSSLKTHYQIHAGVKPYICEVCYKTFSKKSILDIHILTHSGERKFLCEICDKRFARKTDLEKHLVIHTGKKPFHCDLCEKSFNHVSNLKKHKLTHLSDREKRHVCDICRQAFTQKDVLLNHLKIHFVEESLKQSEASDREKNRVKSYLKTMIKKHFHKCNECDKLFLRNNRLQKHKLTHKSDYKMIHICDVCHARFKSKDTLQEHLLNHVVMTFNSDTFDPFDDINSTLGLEPGDTFDFFDDLNLTNSLDTDPNLNFDLFDDINLPHNPNHESSGKKFKNNKTCDICFKTFTRKSSLNDHYLIHSGEKPHKCDLCEKSFSQKITLKRHLLTHSGARPFTCKICSKNFARKTSLSKHYVSHSSNKLF